VCRMRAVLVLELGAPSSSPSSSSNSTTTTVPRNARFEPPLRGLLLDDVSAAVCPAAAGAAAAAAGLPALPGPAALRLLVREARGRLLARCCWEAQLWSARRAGFAVAADEEEDDEEGGGDEAPAVRVTSGLPGGATAVVRVPWQWAAAMAASVGGGQEGEQNQQQQQQAAAGEAALSFPRLVRVEGGGALASVEVDEGAARAQASLAGFAALVRDAVAAATATGL